MIGCEEPVNRNVFSLLSFVRSITSCRAQRARPGLSAIGLQNSLQLMREKEGNVSPKGTKCALTKLEN